MVKLPDLRKHLGRWLKHLGPGNENREINVQPPIKKPGAACGDISSFGQILVSSLVDGKVYQVDVTTSGKVYQVDVTTSGKVYQVDVTTSGKVYQVDVTTDGAALVGVVSPIIDLGKDAIPSGLHWERNDNVLYIADASPQGGIVAFSSAAGDVHTVLNKWITFLSASVWYYQCRGYHHVHWPVCP